MHTAKKLVLKQDILAGKAHTGVSNVIINCEGNKVTTATLGHEERSTAERGKL